MADKAKPPLHAITLSEDEGRIPADTSFMLLLAGALLEEDVISGLRLAAAKSPILKELAGTPLAVEVV